MQQPFPMNPGNTLDVVQDWTAWLAGSAISSVSCTPDTGMSVAGTSFVAGVVTAVVHLDAGQQENQNLRVACTITTADATPRICTRSWWFKVTRL